MTPRFAFLPFLLSFVVCLGGGIFHTDRAGAGEEVLLIPDYTGKNIHKFDPNTGDHLGILIDANSPPLSYPLDCAVNSTGILISDQWADGVFQYDHQGVFVRPFATGIDNVHGMAAHNGILYVTSRQGYSVLKFDLESGAPLGDFIPYLTGGLVGPVDILFRVEDVLVSADIGGPDGGHIRRYDLLGRPLGNFAPAFGYQMCQAANGNILLSGREFNVWEYSPPGNTDPRVQHRREGLL